MGQNLVLTIRLHDGRYHGTPSTEWPPPPSRVFQALVAGSACGNEIGDDISQSLQWLECLPAPTIAAPRAHLGDGIDLFVPNNDLDSVGGDPAKIGEIRVKKAVQPLIFEASTPLIYSWPMAGDSSLSGGVLKAAEGLYQLGRGVDMAWAQGELLDDAELASRLSAHAGLIYEPSSGGGGDALPCPAPGSFASLVERHRAAARKIRAEGEGKGARTLFTQPPKPRFTPVAYGSKAQWKVFEIKSLAGTAFWPWPLRRASELVEKLRDAALAKLQQAMASRLDVIERALLGRMQGHDAPGQRIQILPLPSIGHEHVDPAIRRVAVEVPNSCPLRAPDVFWAFSGLYLADSVTGEVGPFVLTPSEDRGMLENYEGPSSTWRTVTAIALPERAKRRRIEPSRQREEAKGASERIEEELRAAEAIRVALQYSGVRTPAARVRVQREPFDKRGAKAEAFAEGSRFAKERIWHAEVELRNSISGPLVIGDGRFLGLGLMAPVKELFELRSFSASAQESTLADGMEIARALRRAVMSRVQRKLGRREIGSFFSGHSDDGTPLRTTNSGHLAFHWDAVRQRMLVIAPHLLDRRAPTGEERRQLGILGGALDGMDELLAGRAGRYALVPCIFQENEAYLTRAKKWLSVSPYTVTRHRRGSSSSELLTADVHEECRRSGLPAPTVCVLATRGVSGLGLQGKLELSFPVAVAGPVVLGRTRYLGGGLFYPVEAR